MKHIFITGHKGLVGSALLRELQNHDCNIVVANRAVLDLRSEQDVIQFLIQNRIDEIYLCAGTVGGIQANIDHPVAFLYDNVLIATSVIHAAYIAKVPKLLYFGSSCMYPNNVSAAIHEDDLFSGTLEPTNRGYALAKLVGVELINSYRSQYSLDYRFIIPTNLYGIHDNFKSGCHVIPDLINKFHSAKVNDIDHVEIWGDGSTFREFLFSDDLAKISIDFLKADLGISGINASSGDEVTIAELAYIIKKVVGYNGNIEFNATKPSGTFRKHLDLTRMRLLPVMFNQFQFKSLEIGLHEVYRFYLNHLGEECYQ